MKLSTNVYVACRYCLERLVVGEENCPLACKVAAVERTHVQLLRDIAHDCEMVRRHPTLGKEDINDPKLLSEEYRKGWVDAATYLYTEFLKTAGRIERGEND